MNQLKSQSNVNNPKHLKDIKDEQFLYLGRWVNKSTFRAFVYDKEGKQKLANSYDEFEKLTTSGIWFITKDDALQKRKLKNDIALPNCK